MQVKLINPHPGFAGAAMILPKQIKEKIDELTGQTRDLKEVIKEIEMLIKSFWEFKFKVSVAKPYNYLSLKLYVSKDEYPHHFFKLLDMEEIKND